MQSVVNHMRPYEKKKSYVYNKEDIRKEIVQLKLNKEKMQ
jgi:hypothetical protein